GDRGRGIDAFTYILFPQVETGDRQSGLLIHRRSKKLGSAFYGIRAITQKTAAARHPIVLGHGPHDRAGLIDLEQPPAWRELSGAVMPVQPGSARLLHSAGKGKECFGFIGKAGEADRVGDESSVAAPGVAITSAGLTLAVEFGGGDDGS